MEQPLQATQTALSINNFAIQFLKQTDITNNAILSPISLITALYIVHLGTHKKSGSSKELSQVLHLSEFDGHHKGLQSIYENLENGLGEQNNKNEAVRFDVANLLLNNEQNTGVLKREFKDSLENYYDITMAQFKRVVKSSKLPRDILLTDKSRPIDLDVISTKQISDLVNTWVSNITNGKIDQLLSNEMLSTRSESLAVILVNAVYLKAEWEHFDLDSTRYSEFYNNGNMDQKANTSFMHAYNLYVPYYKSISQNQKLQQSKMDGILGTIEFEALELPFNNRRGKLVKDNDVSLVLLLPKRKDGLAELEEALTSSKLMEIYESLERTQVNVFLPKFKLEQSHDADEKLKEMGIKKMFEYREASLTEMFDSERPIQVDKVIHKATIGVDESGIEASGATAAIMMTMSSLDRHRPPTFHADHPFLFIVRHVKTSASLFIGRLTQL